MKKMLVAAMLLAMTSPIALAKVNSVDTSAQHHGNGHAYAYGHNKTGHDSGLDDLFNEGGSGTTPYTGDSFGGDQLPTGGSDITSAVPEPAAYALLSVGLLGLLLNRRRRTQR